MVPTVVSPPSPNPPHSLNRESRPEPWLIAHQLPTAPVMEQVSLPNIQYALHESWKQDSVLRECNWGNLSKPSKNISKQNARSQANADAHATPARLTEQLSSSPAMMQAQMLLWSYGWSMLCFYIFRGQARICLRQGSVAHNLLCEAEGRNGSLGKLADTLVL